MTDTIYDWIEACNIKKYFIYDDNSIDILEDLSYPALCKFSNFPFKINKVEGNFDVAFKLIDNIKNMPNYVSGNCNLSHNFIKNIDNSFSLYVGKNLSLSYNKFANDLILDNIHVGGCLFIDGCKKIKNLIINENVSCKSVFCEENNLEQLIVKTKNIKSFYLNNTYCKSVILLKNHLYENFIYSDNRINLVDYNIDYLEFRHFSDKKRCDSIIYSNNLPKNLKQFLIDGFFVNAEDDYIYVDRLYLQDISDIREFRKYKIIFNKLNSLSIKKELLNDIKIYNSLNKIKLLMNDL